MSKNGLLAIIMTVGLCASAVFTSGFALANTDVSSSIVDQLMMESQWVEKELQIPVRVADLKLSPYIIRALWPHNPLLKNPPLIVLSHGSPLDPKERMAILPENMRMQAKEFLKLGFAVLIPERRGFGKSKETYQEFTAEACDYRAAGERASEDILGAVQYAQANLPVDQNHVYLVGQSAGGYSSIYATSFQPKGVRGVLNFAGGRGARGIRDVCEPQRLIAAVEWAGRTSRVPQLWIYNENDLCSLSLSLCSPCILHSRRPEDRQS